jgi:hypothetical protein
MPKGASEYFPMIRCQIVIAGAGHIPGRRSPRWHRAPQAGPLHEQYGEVILQPAAGVAQHVPVEPPERRVRIRPREQGWAALHGLEGTSSAACLADAVGIAQHPVARAE